MREANLLQAFIASEYWEALECTEALATNDLWYLLSPRHKKYKTFLMNFHRGIHSVAYFQSFHSSSDELEEDTFLSLIVE